MKVTIDIDCTPDEARRFMGLPDVAAAQQAVVEAWQAQALDAIKAMDPQALFKAWMPGAAPGGMPGGMPGAMPGGGEAWEQFQNAFWSAMGGQGGGQGGGPAGGKPAGRAKK
jgi:hypothetical protein